jgi:glycosyltransferase involved in cell wall biosynthesis
MDRPRLSVIIAAHDAAPALEQCLRALAAQATPPAAEIIVAESSSEGTADRLRSRFPTVRFLSCPGSWTLPRLRGRAIGVATGEIIAVLDPFSIVREDWLNEVLRAHEQRPNLAIGGAVELYDAERQGFWSWTTYINEYGMFMLPLQPGETGILPGSNVSYKRSALFDEGGRPKHDEFWKTFVHSELQVSGSPLWLAPSVVVSLNKPIPFWEFFRTRYYHGRCFAAMRTATAGALERWLRALSFPLLPSLLLWRWGRVYFQKRRYPGRLVLSTPFQFLLFSSWAWGECAGYARGAGSSCRQLFY